MVCPRCVTAVENVLNAHQLPVTEVLLGTASVAVDSLTEPTYALLKQDLQALGFELIEDKRKVMVATVKAAVINLVHHQNITLNTNLSAYLSQQLDKDYAILAAAFSAEEQSTIERFYIQQKIERAKELISYGELTLSEIAFKLAYSSVAHLSAQFKKEVGLTPTAFRQNSKRNAIDKF